MKYALVILALSGLPFSCRALGHEMHVEHGEGHLAYRATAEASWQYLSSRHVPSLNRWLRTSPAGPVEITVPDANLFLAADTTIEFDVAMRRIRVQQGRIRLTTSATGTGDWHLVAGPAALRCSAGTEVTVTSAVERPVINILRGRSVLVMPGHPDQVLNGPLEDAASKVPKPIGPEAALSWRQRAQTGTVPHRSQGMGQLLTAASARGLTRPLMIARFSANVVLQAPRALIQIDQTFYNPSSQDTEGTFVFNLPHGASVSRFAMYVTDEKLIEGELIDRSRADEVYTTIVRSQRDPAILEQIGSNLFRMRVFPIFARSFKRILLDYTIPLEARDSEYRFDLPLVSDQPVIRDFSLRGVIHPPVNVDSVQSISNPGLSFKTLADGRVTFADYRRDQPSPTRFSLRYAMSRTEVPSVRIFRPEGDHQYFVARVPARFNPVTPDANSARDVLLLVDTSEGGQSLRPALQAARSIAAGLQPQDRLQLGCVDTSYRALMGQWDSPDGPQAQAGWRRMRDQFELGVDQLHLTLLEAAKAFESSPTGRRRMLIYIGNGPSVRTPDITLPGIEFIAVRTRGENAVRDGISSWLSRQVALLHGVEFHPDLNANMIRELFEWSLTGSPSLPHVQRVAVDGQPEIEVHSDRVWSPGKDLQIAGRSPHQDSLMLQVTVAGQTISIPVTAGPDTVRDDDVIAGRIWAECRLSAATRGFDGESSLSTEEIVALCQEWSLLTPWTAYLVLETEQDYVRWGIERTRRRRYWRPEDAVATRPERLRPIRGVTRAADKGVDIDEEVLRSQLNRIERLLERERFLDAESLLASLRRSAMRVEPERFQRLWDRTQKKARPEHAFQLLLSWRPLVDRQQRSGWETGTRPPLPFLTSSNSAEFREHFPYAETLLKVTPGDLPHEMKLADFAAWIRDQTGLSVTIDKSALEEEHIDQESPVRLKNLAGISIHSLLREALGDVDLTYVPQRHFLKITTATAARKILEMRTYVIDDLLSGESPHHDRLRNPFLNREESARRQIELCLKKPISVDVDDVPLDQLTQTIGDWIGRPIRLDRKGLEFEGIAFDTCITISLQAVPAEDVLNEVLSPLGLTTMVRNESLVVSNLNEENKSTDARVYSIAGLQPPRTTADPLNLLVPFGVGGMAAMGGGMGGGMGGRDGAPGLPSGGIATAPTCEPFRLDEADLTANETDTIDQDWIERSRERPRFGGFPQTLSDDLARFVFQIGGRWQDFDGDGGTFQWYPRARSMVLRQSNSIHRQIQSLLEELRGHAEVPIDNGLSGSNADDQPVTTPEQLLELIQQSVNGSWMNRDAEGGSLFAVGRVLTVFQTAQTHQEIERLLTQLRRATVTADNVSRQSTLRGIDEWSHVRGPAMTVFPSVAPSTTPVDPAELALLAWRQPRVPAHQNWDILSDRGSRHTVVLWQDKAALQLDLPGRVLRIVGDAAAVSYPDLTLVEQGNWGDAARRVVDAVLPWMPHRTNEELAALFDVDQVEDDPGAITLRLSFPGMKDTYLEPTFSKLTRQPTQWKAIAGGELQFKLAIEPRGVIATDGEGREIERWTLINEVPLSPIPGLGNWPGAVIEDFIKPDSSLMAALCRLVEQDEFTSICQLLEQILGLEPRQPLLNLMWAWSLERLRGADPAVASRKTEALKIVAASGADGLIEQITLTNFPSQSPHSLAALLRSIPESQRSASAWAQLAEFERLSSNPEKALIAINQALAVPADPVVQSRRLLFKFDVLMRAQRTDDATGIVSELAGATPTQLLQVADRLAGAGQYDESELILERVLGEIQATGSQVRQLIEMQASRYPVGPRRWRLLLKAHEADPTRHSGAQDLVDQIGSEATMAEHAGPLGELAKGSKRRLDRGRLRIFQANLLEDATAAAAVVAMLVHEGTVPDAECLWAVHLLERGQRSAEVVELLEFRLRRGLVLDRAMRISLQHAYRQLNRNSDAERAAGRF